jgi:hypothetical protein
MDITWKQVLEIWETLKMSPIEARDQGIAKVRNEINEMDRSLRGVWDFFEEENWQRAEREALSLHYRAKRVHDMITELHKKDESGPNNGDSAAADPPHSGPPAV